MSRQASQQLIINQGKIPFLKGTNKGVDKISGYWRVMGRVKKIFTVPSERMRDCLSAFSNRGVRTKAKTRGAGS
jgi:hypothetical protein